MRIHLRRTDIGVPEKFLHAPEVPARFEQVGLDAEAGTTRPVVDPQLHGTSTDALPVAAHKERSLIDSGNSGALLEPGLDRINRESTYRQYPRLIPFACDPQRAIGKIDSGQVDRDQ